MRPAQALLHRRKHERHRTCFNSRLPVAAFFSGTEGSSQWFTQSTMVNVPPGGTRLVASVASWQIAFGSVENKISSLGVLAGADPNAFPQIWASIGVIAFNPSDPNPTVAPPNPW